jgi:hypothetical protein
LIQSSSVSQAATLALLAAGLVVLASQRKARIATMLRITGLLNRMSKYVADNVKGLCGDRSGI